MGSFKFIYVNLLPDESPPSRRRRCDSKNRRSNCKPKTLEEVLDGMGLTVRPTALVTLQQDVCASS